MTPDELSTVLPDLIRFEGLHRHLYLDSRGYPTTGIGNLVKTVEYSLTLPWAFPPLRSIPSPERIREDYARVNNMKPNMPAGKYLAQSALLLPESFVAEFALQRLETEFVPALVRIFPAFESFPLAAKSALIDCVYGLGEGREVTISNATGLPSKATGLRAFKNLRRAVESRLWLTAADTCRIKTRRDERNDWVAGQFNKAAMEKPEATT